MTDPGLSNRLRQHSRRSGLMVGLSMAAAIAICVGGFAAIYAFSLPWVSDFVPLQAQERTPTPEPIVAQAAPADTGPAPTSVLDAITANQNDAAAPAVGPGATQVPEPTEAPETFEATHQSNSATTINFRSSPGVPAANEPANLLYALPPSTPLRSLEERQVANDEPWMRFRNEQGDEGWIREIDAEQFEE